MSRKIGLQLEIVLNIALLVGAALLFGGLLLLKLSEQQLVEQKVADITTMGHLLARVGLDPDSLTPPLKQLRLIEDLLRTLPASSAPESWGIVDASLRTVSALGPRAVEPPGEEDLRQARFAAAPLIRLHYRSTWFPLQSRQPVYVLVTVGLFSSRQFIGAVQARYSLADITERLQRGQNLVFLYVLSYGTVLVVFGAYLLGRNVVHPVRRLLQTTRRVAAGDLTLEVPVSGPGEIAELAGAFNGMLQALRQSRRETEEHIASLQQVNAELLSARQQLLRSERLASVGHLAAGMAHEIGNPLGAIIGYLELLKAELPDRGQADLAERSLAEAARIDRLVRDLLDFAAPDKEEQGRADPARVLAEARTLLQRQGKFEGLDLVYDCPERLPAVRVTDRRLLQVLINLVLNACDALAGRGTLGLSGGVAGDAVWLAVSDSGPGIPDEVQRQMFDPFYSTKPEGKGRGLGLAVCHRIVEEAGGRIEVRSGAGAGTTFTVRLPTVGDAHAG